MTEWDEQGRAIQGTYPVSTVTLGMWKADGSPVPSVDSAVCHRCGGWASHLWTASKMDVSDAGDPMTDARISRRVAVVVYGCPEHQSELCDELVEEFGSANNAYEADELAVAVALEQQKYRRVSGQH